MVSSSAFDMLVILVIGLCLTLSYFVWKVSSELNYHEELLREHIEVLNDHAEHLENAKNVLNNHANNIDSINNYLKDVDRFIEDLDNYLGDLEEQVNIEGGEDQNG